MDNPETQATLGIQDIERRQPRDTGNIRHTRHRTKKPRDTGNIRHTIHRTKTTQTLATLGIQDIERRQSKKHNTEN